MPPDSFPADFLAQWLCQGELHFRFEGSKVQDQSLTVQCLHHKASTFLGYEVLEKGCTKVQGSTRQVQSFWIKVPSLNIIPYIHIKVSDLKVPDFGSASKSPFPVISVHCFWKKSTGLMNHTWKCQPLPRVNTDQQSSPS